MDRESFIQDIVDELMKRLQMESYRVYVIGDIPDAKYNNQGIEFLSCSSYNTDDDIVLITAMSPIMLANLANGLAKTREEDIILNRLLNGKKVFVLEDAFEYQRYRRTAYKALFHLYQDYEMKLRNYGILVIQTPIEIFKESIYYNKRQYQQITDLNYNGNDVSNDIIGKVDWRKKHLLLEKDFKNSRLNRNRVVLITKDCIITPMARDYIREHQIHIERG